MSQGGDGSVSLGKRGTFSSFRNPVFNIYFASMFWQWGALSTEILVRSLLAYRITGSAAFLGAISLANALPMLLSSFLGGVLADRVQKKWVVMAGFPMFASNSLGIALALSMGIVSAERPDSWWILLAYSVVSGTVQGLMMPARQSLIAEIVGESQLMNAVALTTFGQNINRLMMPALGGFLVEAFDFAATYYVMTGLYVLSALFAWFLPNTSIIVSRGRSAFEDMKDGFQYVRGDPTILLLLVVTLFMVIFSMPYMTLLPIFTEDILKVGAGGMGVLISVSGVGTMAGSIVLASLPDRRRGAIMVWGGLLLGLALVGFSFSNLWPLSLVMIVFVGVGQAVRMTLSNTLLQYYTANEYRGRVMSIYMMEFGLTSFGTFLAGAMSDVIGVQWSVGGLAALLIIMSILVLVFVPRMRRLD